MRSNRHQHRAPTMQGYDIVAAQQHAPTHRLSFPLRLPAKSCTAPSLTPWGSLRNHAQLQASPSSSDFSGLWYRDTMTTNTQTSCAKFRFLVVGYSDFLQAILFTKLPGRSGPKRLGCELCGMALTIPSPPHNVREAFTAVPHPRLGRCLSTLV